MDKNREREILSLIYPDGYFESIVDSEEPDFIVARSKELSSFGVEVTEVYRSGATARLANISTYFNELISGGPYHHKDDPAILEVHDVDIYTKEGVFKQSAKTILERGEPVADCISRIEKAIRDKEAKIERYLTKDLSHVNLIVYDNQSSLANVDVVDFGEHLLPTSLIDVLFSTRFREIYYVGLIERRQVYVPLRMTLLMSEYYKFTRILFDPELLPFTSKEAVDRIESFDTLDDVALLFALYLRRQTNDVRIVQGLGPSMVVMGNAGIWPGDGKNNVYMQDDLPIPNVSKEPSTDVEPLFELDDFKARESLFDGGKFSTELVFDVRAR